MSIERVIIPERVIARSEATRQSSGASQAAAMPGGHGDLCIFASLAMTEK